MRVTPPCNVAPAADSRAPDDRGDPAVLADRLRVVHLTSVHQPFDARIFSKECVSLARAGYDVALIVPGEADSERAGVRIRHVVPANGRLSRMLLTTWRVYRAARREKARLYHFHDPELLPAGLMLRLGGARVIYDVHEDVPLDILSKYWIPGWARRFVAALAATLECAASRTFLSAIVAAVPSIAQRFPPARTVTVFNYPILEEMLALPSNAPYAERENVVVYVGAVARIRGIIEGMQAMQLVSVSGARLVVGGPFNSAAITREVEEHKGAVPVEFHGWLDRREVAALLNRARIGLVLLHPLPNFVVSYPLKMFEYMASGLPIVASDFPLWRELFSDIGCCRFVDPFNVREIADAIDWLLQHPGEARDMGERGRAAVASGRFSWASEERKLLNLYAALIDGRAPIDPTAPQGTPGSA